MPCEDTCMHFNHALEVPHTYLNVPCGCGHRSLLLKHTVLILHFFQVANANIP